MPGSICGSRRWRPADRSAAPRLLEERIWLKDLGGLRAAESIRIARAVAVLARPPAPRGYAGLGIVDRDHVGAAIGFAAARPHAAEVGRLSGGDRPEASDANN